MVPDTSATREMTLHQFPQNASRCYAEIELSRLDRKLAMFRALPAEDRALLPEFEPRITALAECVQANFNLLRAMVTSAETIHIPAAGFKPSDGDGDDDAVAATTNTNGLHDGEGDEEEEERVKVEEEEEEERQLLSREVRRGLALLARDWSAVGAAQRDTLYQPLIAAVEEAYSEASRAVTLLSRNKFRVLVPGAGAGRLAWELVRKGFAVEGCEESFTALLVGNFALNWTAGVGGNVFYPFVHEHCNVRRGEVGTRGVEIPDVDPKGVGNDAEFAMRAGAFVEGYEGQDGSWDAVCSCVGFDLGEGAIAFVRRVAQVVKAGGIWAFVGPVPCLDGGGGDAIHLSVDEVMGIVRKSGFKIVKREEVSVLHSDDPESMRLIHLRVPLVVAVKVRPAL